jgi:WD40 repeat protein
VGTAQELLIAHSKAITTQFFNRTPHRCIFYSPIRYNPAHIYLSALPFTPPKSLISTYYLKAFPNVLHLSVDTAEEPQPVVTAAISGELIAVVIANASLKVFNLDHEGAEVFHAQIDPIPFPEDRYGSTPGYCIAISGGGKMVTLGRDNCYVWHLDNGRTRRIVLAQGIVARTTCLAFSDDGEHLVTGFNNGDLHEWVLKSGVEGRQFLWPRDDDSDGLGRQDVIAAIYAQTDDRIISGSAMSRGPPRFCIWSRSGDCTFSYFLTDKWRTLSSCWLISACYDAGNEWWQIQDSLTGELQFKFRPMLREYSNWYGKNDRWNVFVGPRRPVAAISSDGKLAAFGLSQHPSIFIWDVHANTQLAELVGHSDCLTSVAFAASHGNSKYRLVTTSLDGTIRLWDLNQLFKPKEDQHPMTSWRICLEADEHNFRRGCTVQNGNGEHLFWLPEYCPIRHPLNTLVIGQCAEIDMTDFVYGKEWTKCRGSKDSNEHSKVKK